MIESTMKSQNSLTARVAKIFARVAKYCIQVIYPCVLCEYFAPFAVKKTFRSGLMIQKFKNDKHCSIHRITHWQVPS